MVLVMRRQTWMLWALGLGLCHALAQAVRLLSRDQGWPLSELAPALALETGLAVAVSLVLLGALSRLPRPGVRVAVCLLLLLSLSAWGALAHPGRRGRRPPGPAELEGPPTLVLLTLDTLRRDHVSAWPGALVPDLTPHLDALAASGLRFDDAVTTSPLTLPSHTTLLSGAPPDRHGVVHNGRVVPRSLEGAPDVLAGAGYRTAAFVSSSVLHGSHGLARWFHVYRDELGPWPGARRLPMAGLLPLDRSRSRLVKEPGDQTVRRALDWLARQGGAPVFLWVHLYDAHKPYASREGSAPAGATLPDPCAWRDSLSASRAGPRSPMAMAPRRGCGQATRRRVEGLARSYAGEVAFLDAQVGRLVTGLQRLGRWEDAALVAVADHGESLAEHHQHGSHEHSLYDPVARVPLLVRAPGLAPGVVEAQTSTLRVAATLLDLVGLAPEEGMAGPSLLELPDVVAPAVVVGPSPLGRMEGNHPLHGSALQVAVRLPPYKTLVDGDGYVERYDLATDPLEQQPRLTSAERQQALRMQRKGLSGPLGLPPPPGLRRRPQAPEALTAAAAAAEVARWSTLDGTARGVLEAWATGAARERSGMDGGDELPPEVLDALRSLGYTE